MPVFDVILHQSVKASSPRQAMALAWQRLRESAAGELAFTVNGEKYHFERHTPEDILTSRQQDVAHLISSGHDNDSIAKALSLQICTVKDIVGDVCRRLGVRNRIEIATTMVKAELRRKEQMIRAQSPNSQAQSA